MICTGSAEGSVDYFIKKFRVIPARKWNAGQFLTPDKTSCALGHCGSTEQYGHTDEAIALINLFYFSSLKNGGPAAINDGHDPAYQQPHPKQRILAALEDINNANLRLHR